MGLVAYIANHQYIELPLFRGSLIGFVLATYGIDCSLANCEIGFLYHLSLIYRNPFFPLKLY